MPKNRKTPNRRVSARRVKQAATYEVAEVAKLLGVCRGTVRRWLKAGLEPIDKCRPILIHGAALKAFLGSRQATRRSPCGPDEFYCFRCRSPRKPFGGLVDVHPRAAKVVRLTGICEHCDTLIHRTASRASLPKLAALFDLQTLGDERLDECSNPKPDGDFGKV